MMKNIIKIVFCAVLFIVCYSCKSDDMNFKDVQVSEVKSLYAPSDNKAVKLISSSSASLFFEWEPVKTEDGGAALYEIVFDKVGGDFSKPLYKLTSNNNGYLSNANVTHKTLNAIAVLAGVNPGEAIDVIWTVVASRGLSQAVASQSHKLNVTSLEGFADVPNELYVTGEGSEGGTDPATGIEFKQVSAGEFEVYTKLEAGKKYAFIDRKNASARVFYTDDQVKLKELTGENTMTVSKTAVYRINIDFNVATINFVEIDKIGVWFSPDNKVLFNLPYQGKGVWSGQGVVKFKQESWGKDQRYKFQMNIIANGKAEISQLGTKISNDNPPNASSDPSYYYVKVLPNVTQWDDKWKFIDAVDNKTSTISVILQGDKEYTHSVVVN